MSRLSKKQKDKLMKQILFTCPFCGKEPTYCDSIDSTIKHAWTVEHCENCGKSYRRIYDLARVEGIEGVRG